MVNETAIIAGVLAGVVVGYILGRRQLQPALPRPQGVAYPERQRVEPEDVPGAITGQSLPTPSRSPWAPADSESYYRQIEQPKPKEYW